MANNSKPVRCLIESEAFPFEFLSALAKRESWRKEVYRPVYHVHKWWAKRLGSIFRGILLGSVLPEDVDLEHAFYRKHEFSTIRVFDPFMGSGTTVGEAQKLGMTVLGRDVNPVACETVRVALSPIDRDLLLSAFNQLASSVGQRIRQLYKVKDEKDRSCEVLYYFWVKHVPCPECGRRVDLFPNYTFARNAYPKKKPEIQVYCPSCEGIFQARYDQEQVTCKHCHVIFNPKLGTTQGAKVTCTFCKNTFSVAKAVRALEEPPPHRLYAKLVLSPGGEKRYLRATDLDRKAYSACEQWLTEEVAQGRMRLPEAKLSDGHNTRQALGYNYTAWRDFFNARQLLALGWLHGSIAELPEGAERGALLALFSGTLEFNNLFASYKGEGTGAVRHMFSHHVLKPERMPIEANVWGTPKSSGSFSSLFHSRLLRALDYRMAPFEVGLGRRNKVFGSSKPMGKMPLSPWKVPEPAGIALSCGDSANTALPDQSIDIVVTDPPFFNNVHYSELADFFYAWQTLYPRGFIRANGATTRRKTEVQDTDADEFSNKLRSVFKECRRLIRDHGILVFTYHHARPDGWAALADAVYGAGFTMVQAHPVCAELAAATPKSQAKEPILIDAIIVCRKQEQDKREGRSPDEAVTVAVSAAINQLQRLALAGHQPTKGDAFVAGAAQFFVALGSGATCASAKQVFEEHEEVLRMLLEKVDLEALKKLNPTEEFPNSDRQLQLSL